MGELQVSLAAGAGARESGGIVRGVGSMDKRRVCEREGEGEGESEGVFPSMDSILLFPAL